MSTYLKASAFRQQLEAYKQNLGGAGGSGGANGDNVQVRTGFLLGLTFMAGILCRVRCYCMCAILVLVHDQKLSSITTLRMQQVRRIMGEEGREYFLARDNEEDGGAGAGGRGRGSGSGSGGARGRGRGRGAGAGGKHDQLAIAAAARAAARNVGMPPTLTASIPLAAFKGLAAVTNTKLPHAASAPAAVAAGGRGAGGAAGGAAGAGRAGATAGGGGGAGGGEGAGELLAGAGVVAKGATLELRLSDGEGGGSSDSAKGMFGSSSSGSDAERDAGGAAGARAPWGLASSVLAADGLSSGAGATVTAATAAAAGPPASSGATAAATASATAATASSAPAALLDDVEWEDVDVAKEAAAPSVAGEVAGGPGATPAAVHT